MSKLFVDKSIQINAPAAKVWEVLTEREYTGKWAPEFSRGSSFYLESDWKLGSPVVWKDSENKTIVLRKCDRSGAWKTSAVYGI
jgi:hypothetical protein